MQTLLLLGATGLVGQQVLRAALADASIEHVCAPTRRPLADHPKLNNPIVDFATLPSDAPWWHADAAICTLGTTLKLAGSKQAFRQIDHDYVMHAARMAQSAGTTTFVLNSSLGADPNARSFYLSVKGELEQDLRKLGFSSLTTLRPSLLDGGTRPDWRPGEFIGLWLARVLAPLIPKRYRAVSTKSVADCLLSAALKAQPGFHVIESEQINTG